MLETKRKEWIHCERDMTYRMQGVARRKASVAAARPVDGFSTICDTPQPSCDQYAIEWHMAQATEQSHCWKSVVLFL